MTTVNFIVSDAQYVSHGYSITVIISRDGWVTTSKRFMDWPVVLQWMRRSMWRYKGAVVKVQASTY